MTITSVTSAPPLTTTSVTSGQTSSGLQMGPGSGLAVLYGGIAVSAQALNGGQIVLSSGGVASATIMSGGGVEFVVAGGSAVGGVISALGVDIVSSGGHASGLTVHSGAVAVVLGSSVASAMNLANDALLIVLGSAIVSGTTGPGNVISGNAVVLNSATSATGEGSGTSGQAVTSGQQQAVCYSGTTISTSVGSGGAQFVIGGVASATTLASGGGQFIYLGLATSTQVVAGTTQTVYGGSAFGTVIAGSGEQVVYGGAVSGTLVINGGTQAVYAGNVQATTLTSGSTQYVFGGTVSPVGLGSGCEQIVSGGTASGTQVSSGGRQVVSAGSVSATVVSSGGTLYVQGGTVGGSKVYSGGMQIVSGGIASGALLIDGGVEIVGSAGSGTGTHTIEGGGLIVSAGAKFTGAVNFVGGGSGLLKIGNPAKFAATVSGFGANDTIDLPSLTFTSSGSAIVSGNVLKVTEGGVTASITVDPSGLGGNFLLEGDGDGGTQVSPPCFAEGTRIATERGDVPVETLRPGDRVLLAGGGSAPVVWTGHRRVAPRRHPRPCDVQPVRVAAHAYGLGRPGRDLMLSPDHAVFVDGVLIPVRYLVNGATVRQADVAAVTYWHVELPAHAVLLAEGLPAESFLDTGNRGAFANGAAVMPPSAEFARLARPRDRVHRRLLPPAFAVAGRPADAGHGRTTWIAPRPRAGGIDEVPRQRESARTIR